MTEITINRSDVEKILHILDRFPETEKNFKLEYRGGNGIGYILDIIIPISYNGIPGEFRTEIVGVDSW